VTPLDLDPEDRAGCWRAIHRADSSPATPGLARLAADACVDLADACDNEEGRAYFATRGAAFCIRAILDGAK
jgi:hypothetical protein